MTIASPVDDLILKIKENETNFLSPVLAEDEELASEYRKRRSLNDVKSVHPADVAAEQANGWSVQRVGKRATRLKRVKGHDKWLEDRVWCLLHAMGVKWRTIQD